MYKRELITKYILFTQLPLLFKSILMMSVCSVKTIVKLPTPKRYMCKSSTDYIIVYENAVRTKQYNHATYYLFT